jgi:hypothetical protein
VVVEQLRVDRSRIDLVELPDSELNRRDCCQLELKRGRADRQRERDA